MSSWPRQEEKAKKGRKNDFSLQALATYSKSKLASASIEVATRANGGKPSKERANEHKTCRDTHRKTITLFQGQDDKKISVEATFLALTLRICAGFACQTHLVWNFFLPHTNVTVGRSCSDVRRRSFVLSDTERIARAFVCCHLGRFGYWLLSLL